MPFALVIIGLILIITSAQSTHKAFGTQVLKDFTNGSGCAPMSGQYQDCGFAWWVAAIVAVGALGYIEQFKGFSRAFMVLIIVSMVIANRGVFDQLQAALQAGPTAPTASAAPTLGNGTGSADGSSSVGKAVGGVAGAATGIPGASIIGSALGGLF